jgi:hypothetical protein
MSLQKVLEQITKVAPLASEDTDSGPIETLNARRGRKRNAVEQLKQLRREYASDLLRSSVFILVAGAGREEFVEIATGNADYGVFKSDPESFYKDLAGRIPTTLYKGRESVANLFDVLGRHLEDKAGELGVLEYPQLRYKQEYHRHIASTEDFVELIKNAINDQVGGEFVAAQTIKEVTDQAIERNHSASITPILLSTKDEKLALELVEALNRLTPRVFLVIVGKSSRTLKSTEGAVLVKEASTESVEQALKLVKSSLKK